MSRYDLSSVHSLLGEISGQLNSLSRDISCFSPNDLCIGALETKKEDYLAQQSFACTQLLGQCQIALRISSVEVDNMKNTVREHSHIT